MSDVAEATISRGTSDQRWMTYGGLVALNVVDVFTTAVVIDRGGVEGNPFVQPIVTGGIWQISLTKLAVLMIIALLLVRCRESRIAELALATTAGWYLAVVIWNIAVLTVI